MSWAKLLASNRVTQQPSAKAELDSLRSIVARCFSDVTAKGLSTDARFIMAYDAARTLSVMIVRRWIPAEIGRRSLQHLPRSRSSRPASIRRAISVLRWLPQQTQYLRIRRRRRRYRH